MKNLPYTLHLTLYTTFLLYTLHLTPYTAFAAFKEIGWGTRPSGMGNTFVAIADDANSALYNPAGIAQFERQELTFTLAKPYWGLKNIDLNLMYLSYIRPVHKFGSLGIFITDFASANLYRENIIALTYAHSLFDKICAGLNIKYLTHSYNWDEDTIRRAEQIKDPVVTAKRNRISALTIDMGILYSLERNITLGLNCKNLIPADVGIVYEDKVPIELKTGFAYRIPRWKGMNDFVCGIDISYRFQEWGKVENKLNINLGAETWLFNRILGFRTGVNINEFTLGSSFNKLISRKLLLRIDYACVLSLRIINNFGTHRIALTLRFL